MNSGPSQANGLNLFNFLVLAVSRGEMVVVRTPAFP
jgi:hypothetical protein